MRASGADRAMPAQAKKKIAPRLATKNSPASKSLRRSVLRAPLTLTYRRRCRTCGRTPGASGQRRSNQQGWVPPGSDETWGMCPTQGSGWDRQTPRRDEDQASGCHWFALVRSRQSLVVDANWQLASGGQERKKIAARLAVSTTSSAIGPSRSASVWGRGVRSQAFGGLGQDSASDSVIYAQAPNLSWSGAPRSNSTPA